MSVSQAVVSLSAQQARVLGVLLPHLCGMAVDRAEISEGLVSVWVRAAADGAACPGCGSWCTAVHDRYLRRLRDAAAGGRRVLIWLVVRLLRCGNAQCPRASFAEQPEGLAVPYARRTPLLAGQLGAVAAALAGRAGSRLARAVLAVEVSRHTLIRLLMALPGPAAGPVRVLGIDDFSLRKGRDYATLLVDVETGEPVDVLPDREAGTAREWLEGHPEVEVICRDRAGAYAEAARDGAPQAVQVADRWHIWHNLCEYAGKAVARHQGCLAGPGCAGPARQQEQQPQEQGAGVPAGRLDAVIRQRHAAVHQLRARGATLPEAAAALGLSQQTAGRFWRAGSADALLRVRGVSALDPWKPYLLRRWDAGTTTIAALHREITALGYAGSEPTTYAWLALLKLAAPPAPPAPPSKQQVTGWMLTDPARLDDGRQEQPTAILGHCPELQALAGHVTAFAKILTHRAGDRLDGWLAAAGTSPGQPELASFANGIRRDYQAVRNALTLEWSSGCVEGLNTRTKLIKRQMYGRASFPLLRKRILLTS
ncbi:MAG TPA: ISL3 family transposase [Streptosporangiaceae bacterium]